MQHETLWPLWLAVVLGIVLAPLLRERLIYLVVDAGPRLSLFVAAAAWGTRRYGDAQAVRATSALNGMQYRGRHFDQEASHWPGWAVIYPVLSAVQFIPLLLAELWLNDVRIEGVIGLASGWLAALGLDVVGSAALALTMALITVTLGQAIIDIMGGVPGAYVWHNVHLLWRRVLAALFCLAMLFNVAAAVILAVEGQAANDSLKLLFIPFPTLSFNALLVMALHVALFASGASLPSLAVVIWMGALWVLSLVSRVVSLLLCIAVWLYEFFLSILVGGLDVMAVPGRTLWNWLADFEWAVEMGIRQLPEPLPPRLPSTELPVATISRLRGKDNHHELRVDERNAPPPALAI